MPHGQPPKTVLEKVRLIEKCAKKPKYGAQAAAEAAWRVIKRHNGHSWALSELSTEAKQLLGLA